MRWTPRTRRRVTRRKLNPGMDLQGCGTALVTPFRHDGGIDEVALHAHVNWQIANGVSLLIPAGTTGETATLSEQEWLRVVEITVNASGGRVPVFAGATHNNTAQAVENARKLARIDGLTGILTANPYYNRPGQEGQYQHFKAIAEGVDLPILLYNIPSRTGANLEPDTVLRLTEFHNIVGIKESSGLMTQITAIITQAPRAFRVFAGDDALTLPTIALGGVGVISVASNAIPQQMSQWSKRRWPITGSRPGEAIVSTSASCRRSLLSLAPRPSRLCWRCLAAATRIFVCPWSRSRPQPVASWNAYLENWDCSSINPSTTATCGCSRSREAGARSASRYNRPRS